MEAKLKFDRILFATDFLESSRLSLDYAVGLAHRFHATLVLLHVIELLPPSIEAEVITARPSLSRADAEKRLEGFASGVRRTGLSVEAHVEDGIPAAKILESVCSRQADLLVMGIYGMHRGLAHLLLGSNTEKILLSATCPVLTVGPHVLAGVDLVLDLKEILYIADLTPEAAAAAPYALFLAREFQVPVDVCQLVSAEGKNDPKVCRNRADDYCEALHHASPEAEASWVTPAFHLKRGMELAQILDRAQTQTAGMIVLGVHIQSQLERHLHSSLAYQLLAKAVCPVLTVRSV